MKIREVTVDRRIDALLVEWHQCRHGDSLAWAKRGTTSPGTDYVAPGHHDWANGAADARAEKQRIAGICMAAEAVPKPWFYALQTNARHLAKGVLIWPSFIATDEREVLLLEARNKFAAEVLRRKETIG